jgi:hypothetical protein
MHYLKSVTAILVFSCSAAYAKEPAATKPMDHKAMMETYQKLAQPGEPHAVFASLEGSWLTKTKEWMDPAKPPMESEGSAEFKMLLGGRYLQQDIQATMMGQPFTGIAIDAFDNVSQRYQTIWMSTTGTGIFMMEGTASKDGRTITLTGSHPEPGGGKMHHRAVWKIIDSDHQQFEMYGSGAMHGNKEMKVMEITYTRK